MAQTITVPEELFDRLARTAEAMHVPVDEVARRALSAGLPPDVDDVPEEHRVGLQHLEERTDEALWAVWRSQPAPEHATRHAALLDKHSDGELSPVEHAEMRRLRTEMDSLLLHRAHAAALLRWRGHAVPIND